MNEHANDRSEEIVFDVIGSGERIALGSFRLVVAGYTGRDEAAVRAHIDELAAIGVPAPESVPMFYELDEALVTQADAVPVSGANTSGEVEPVIVRTGGRLFLGVGSDHTDRDIERESVAASKAACPKPVGRSLVEIRPGMDWDAVAAASSVDGRRYQDGLLSALRVPTSVLDLHDSERSHDGDLLIFCGTLPLIDGEFVAGRHWELSLGLPTSESLTVTYDIVRSSD